MGRCSGRVRPHLHWPRLFGAPARGEPLRERVMNKVDRFPGRRSRLSVNDLRFAHAWREARGRDRAPSARTAREYPRRRCEWRSVLASGQIPVVGDDFLVLQSGFRCPVQWTA